MPKMLKYVNKFSLFSEVPPFQNETFLVHQQFYYIYGRYTIPYGKTFRLAQYVQLLQAGDHVGWIIKCD